MCRSYASAVRSPGPSASNPSSMPNSSLIMAQSFLNQLVELLWAGAQALGAVLAYHHDLAPVAVGRLPVDHDVRLHHHAAALEQLHGVQAGRAPARHEWAVVARAPPVHEQG